MGVHCNGLQDVRQNVIFGYDREGGNSLVFGLDDLGENLLVVGEDSSKEADDGILDREFGHG